MKIILIPFFKLIWAVILTLFQLFVHITLGPICFIIYFLWDFKIIPSTFWEYRMTTSELNYSPYYRRNPNHFGLIKFKTIFHYIWNIK